MAREKQRYIDAYKLIKKIFPIGLVDDGKYTINAKAVKHAIDQTPTADVVEVVRCKDCDVPHNKWLGCPNLNGMIPPPEFYCAKGRRREESKDQENKPFNDLYNAFVERSRR